jgi:hypothetical protein
VRQEGKLKFATVYPQLVLRPPSRLPVLPLEGAAASKENTGEQALAAQGTLRNGPRSFTLYLLYSPWNEGLPPRRRERQLKTVSAKDAKNGQRSQTIS